MTMILQLVALAMFCAAGLYGVAGFVFLVAFWALGLTAGFALGCLVMAIIRMLATLRGCLDALAQQWRDARQLHQFGKIGAI
jgi:hypothetical protein